MIIAVDFDGTIVKNAYPDIGAPIENAVKALRYFKEQGHTIIINSCRADYYADEMTHYLLYNDIPFDFINENDPKRTSQYGGDTRKISADIYIDDKNIFCHSIDWNEIMREVDRIDAKKRADILCPKCAHFVGLDKKSIEGDIIERVILLGIYCDCSERTYFVCPAIECEKFEKVKEE